MAQYLAQRIAESRLHSIVAASWSASKKAEDREGPAGRMGTRNPRHSSTNTPGPGR